MKEQFKSYRFRRLTQIMIGRAMEIIEDLRAQGYTLTLRQLYYQMVARDIIPNAQSEYKRLGETLNKARLAGLIDWDAIEDRTRGIKGVAHWDDPSDVILSAAQSFRLDKWVDQRYRIEVWVEKDALIGVVEKACRALDVRWFSCRGYTSQTALYDAGKRLLHYRRMGQVPMVIHLGDHDPSGIDMSRDILDRLEMFTNGSVDVRRIALNMDQIEELQPPPNPAKETDSRFESYRALHGDESWELDALDPAYIDRIITEEVEAVRDDEKFQAMQEKEGEMRNQLHDASARWADVVHYLEQNPS